MKRWLVLALGCAACDPTLMPAPRQLTTVSFDAAARTCPEICESARDELIRDYGVEPGVVVCTVREVQMAQTCAECEQYFLRFGVRFASCN